MRCSHRNSHPSTQYRRLAAPLDGRRVCVDLVNFGASIRLDHNSVAVGQHNQPRRFAMAKGQVKKNKEARKPKKEKPKTIAANPSQKGGGGLSKG
jgi:hypothetical protein